MNSKICFLIIPVLLIICSCATFKYNSPYSYLDHEQHEKTIVEEGMNCFTCHVVDIDEPNMLKRVQMLREMLKESNEKRFVSSTCHQCHVDTTTRVANATSRCISCHDSLKHITPDDHDDGQWIIEHGPQAREASTGSYRLPKSIKDASLSTPTSTSTSKLAKSIGSCDDCHQQWFCINCHNMRDSSMQSMHTRTFKLAHVAAAVSDPASCSSCHTAKYCRDCHSSY